MEQALFSLYSSQINNSASNAVVPLPADRMGNLVKIESILRNETNILSPNDFIQVKVLYSSGVQSFQRRPSIGTSPNRSGTGFGKKCTFMFSDDTGSINGTLYFNDNEDFNYNSLNICHKLKKNYVFKISGCQIVETDQLSQNSNQTGAVNGHQSKTIKLSNSTMDIMQVDDVSFAHIPFDFVRLQDVDNKSENSLIDLIGFVERVSEIKESIGCTYQWVFLKSSYDVMNSFTRKVCLFGGHMGRVRERNVYALTKLVVENFEGNRSLKTSTDSMIMQITEDDIPNVIPPRFQDATFVSGLFPPPQFTLYSQQSSSSLSQPIRMAENLQSPRNIPRGYSPNASTMRLDEVEGSEVDEALSLYSADTEVISNNGSHGSHINEPFQVVRRLYN